MKLRNDQLGGKRLLNQGRLYHPRNSPQCRTPQAQKNQNEPIMKKYGHVPAAMGSGKGKTMMAIAGSYVICAISNITYSVPE